MKDDMDISQPENTSYDKKRKRRINKWGVYLGVIFVVIGVVWYAVNVGIIPFTFIQEQAGPIIIIIIGLLILIRSL